MQYLTMGQVLHGLDGKNHSEWRWGQSDLPESRKYELGRKVCCLGYEIVQHVAITKILVLRKQFCFYITVVANILQTKKNDH